MRTRPMSYAQRLRRDLESLREGFVDLLDQSEIRNVNPNSHDSPLVFVGAADWGWAPGSPPVIALQMELLGRLREWAEHLALLFPHPTPDIETRRETSINHLIRWLERPDTFDFSIPATIDEAKAIADGQLAVLAGLVDVAAPDGAPTGLRVVPDTNALMRILDLASYEPAVQQSTFDVHLLPTVLGELDELKDRGKSSEVRASAQAAARRIKGLRDRGSLLSGVNFTRNIRVTASVKEVDVRSILGWLDPDVPDDRILAGALRLQGDHPSDLVMLVTSDINLQNKAEAAGLPYVETPPNPADLAARLVAEVAWPSRSQPAILPKAILRNLGPTEARNVQYLVAPPEGEPPPHTTCGPWEVGRIDVGGADEQPIVGVFGDSLVVRASWTDGAGAQRDGSWPVDLRETHE